MGTLEDKILGLTQAKTDKLNNLTTRQDTLIGLKDADTPVTGLLGTVRSQPTTGARYDAVEIPHGGRLFEGKSPYSIQQQTNQVASLLGKNPSDITQQDIIDVGNQQQVQKLADLVRSPNEPRWEAPLIRNTPGVDLSDVTTVEGQGLPIRSIDSGKTDANGRVLGSLVNPETGENVTNMASVDKAQNAFADRAQGQGIDFDKSVVGQTTYGENLVDAAQAGVGTFAAKTADTAVDILARGAKRLVGNEAVNKVLAPLDSFNEQGDYIGLDKYKEQTEYGYDPKLVNEADKSIRKAFKDPSVGNVFSALKDALKAGPDVLATSIGDMAAAMAGPVGWAIYAANFNNEILEERAESVGGIDNLTAKDRAIALAGAIPAALVNTLTKGNVGLTGMKEGVQKAVKEGGLGIVKYGVKKGAMSAVGEGLEEGVQEALVTVASKIDTAKEDELMTDKFWEDLAVASGLGFGAGATGSGIGAVKDVAQSDAVKQGVESVKSAVKPTKTEKAENEAPTGEDTAKPDVKYFDEAERLGDELRAAARANNRAEVVKKAKELQKVELEAKNTGVSQIIQMATDEASVIMKEAKEKVLNGEAEVLGAELGDVSADNKRAFTRFIMDSMTTDELVQSDERIGQLAKALNLNTKDLEQDRKDALAVKTFEEVSEDVEGGARGYATYLNDYKDAKEEGRTQAQLEAQVKLERFRDRHEDKLGRFNEAIDDVERQVQDLARGMVESGQVRTVAQALSKIADGDIDYKKGRSTYGNPVKVGTFTMYPENAAQKILGISKDVKSMYSVRDKIAEEVSKMKDIESRFDDVKVPDMTSEVVDEPVVEAPSAVSKKTSVEEDIKDGKDLTGEQRKEMAIRTAKKIYTGKELSAVEEQFRANYPQDVEKVLRAKAKSDAKKQEARKTSEEKPSETVQKSTRIEEKPEKVKVVEEEKKAPVASKKADKTDSQKRAAEDQLEALQVLVESVVNDELKVEASPKFKEERRSFIEDLGKVDGNKVMLPKNITDAMAKAIVAWMATEGKSSTIGTTKKIEQMLGLRKKPSKAAINALRNKGVLRKNVVQELGATAIAELDIDVDKKEDYAKMQNYITNLGNVTYAAMIKRGILVQSSIPTAKFNEFKGIEGGDGDVFFAKSAKEKDSTFNYYKNIADVLGLGNERVDKEPVYSKPGKREKFEFRKRPTAVMSDKDVERLQAQEQIEHSMKYDVANALEGLGEYAKIGAGWVDTQGLNDVHDTELESVRAKNEAIERSLEHVTTHKENLAKSGHGGYYFRYFMSGNGRDMIDSNTFNPQSDKVHRHLDYTGKPVRVEEDGKNWEMFKLAVMQGLGVGVDKDSKTMTDAKWLEVTNEESDIVELAYMATDNVGKLSSSDKKRLAEFMASEEKVHTLDALVALGTYLRAKDRGDNFFDTTLQIEVDAVTSGWILALMQSPVFEWDTVKSFLRKGGVYIDDDTANFQDVSSSKKEPDSYVTVQQEIEKNLEGKLSADTMSILEINRNLAKAPFMTRITYGAGIKGVKDDLAEQFVEAVYSKMAKAKTKDDILKLRRGVKDLAGVDLKGLSLSNKTSYMIDFGVENRIRKVVKETYGKAVEDALDGTYSEFTETRDAVNEAFKEMANEYTKKYEAGFKQLKEKHGKVTKEMLKKFEDDVMAKYIPGIKSPNGSSIQIFKREKMEGVNPSDLRVQNNFLTPIGIGSNAITTTAEIKRIGSAHAAGGVVPIHFIDGVVIGEILKNFQITGVYDAAMIGLEDVENVTKTYNKKFVEVSKDYNLLEEVLRSHEILVGKETEASALLKVKSVKANRNRELIHGSNLNVQHFAMNGIRYESKRKSKGKVQLSNDIMSLAEEQISKGCVK